MITPARSTSRVLTYAAIVVVTLTAACTSVTSGHPVGSASGGQSAPGSAGSPGGAPKLEMRWRTKVGGEPGSETSLVSVTADGSRAYSSDVSGHVFAFGADSGKVLWRAHPGTRSGIGVGVAQGVVYYYDSNAGLSALSASSGRVLWKAEIDPPDTGDGYRPAVAAGIVGLATNDNLQGVDPQTGKVKWRNPAFRFGWTSIVAAGSMFFLAKIGYQSSAATVAAVDARTGKPAWQRNVPAGDEDRVFLAAADGLLLVRTKPVGSDETNSLVALSASTGKQAWKTDALGISSANPPVTAGNAFVYATPKGALAYSIKDGSRAYLAAMDTGAAAAGVVRCATSACSSGLHKLVALDAHGKTVSKAGLPQDGAKLGQESNGVVYLASSSTVYRFS